MGALAEHAANDADAWPPVTRRRACRSRRAAISGWRQTLCMCLPARGVWRNATALLLHFKPSLPCAQARLPHLHHEDRSCRPHINGHCGLLLECCRIGGGGGRQLQGSGRAPAAEDSTALLARLLHIMGCSSYRRLDCPARQPTHRAPPSHGRRASGATLVGLPLLLPCLFQKTTPFHRPP